MKKAFPLFLLIFFFSLNHSFAQSIDWSQTFGGSGEDQSMAVQATADGGFIAVGVTASSNGDVSANNGDGDAWIAKMDADGNLQWAQNYGGTGIDIAMDVQATSDGGYIVAGYSASADGDVGGNNGKFDCWVLKLDNLGALVWEQNLGGTGDDYATSVQQTADGGYVIAGASVSSDGDVSANNGGFDFWIVKLNATGGTQWQANFGGSQDDEARAIVQTADGGYVVSGNSSSADGDVGSNNGGQDSWIIKLDMLGNLQFGQVFGGTGDEINRDIQTTSDGGFILSGYSDSNDGDVGGNNGGYDFWIVKTDGTGNLVWSANYGGSDNDRGQSIQETSDGGFIVSGSTASNDGDVSVNSGDNDFWIVQLDAIGALNWERSIGGSGCDLAYAVQETDSLNYIVAGASGSFDGDVTDNSGNFDFLVVKFNNEACRLDIPLTTGWNIISSCCIPDSLPMEAVWADVANDVIQVKNLYGTYVPSFGFNSISTNGMNPGQWDITQGYQAKVSQDITLSINGAFADPLNTPIHLNAGWNIISYLLKGDSDPVNVFDDIKANVIQVKNLSGAYVPSFGDFNNMGDMIPSQGYQAKVSVDDTLYYDPAYVGLKPATESLELLEAQHYDRKLLINPNNSTLLIFPPENLLTYGDEIGVFSADGRLAGSTVFQGAMMGVMIYGDDASTNQKDGLSENETYTVKVWSPAQQTEWTAELEYQQGSDQYLQDDLAVASFKTNNTGLENTATTNNVRVFPNPASDRLVFELELRESSTVELQIFDAKGQAVSNANQGLFEAGTYQIDYEISNLAAGIYTYRCTTANGVQSGKFNVIR